MPAILAHTFDHEYSHNSQQSSTVLADGLSNGEIARRLYISTKTASVHVSNILAKLNMTSRTEVATWDVRTGLVPPGRGRGSAGGLAP
jgi:DNA-binding NarL/FixJ family response regulator